MARQIRILVIDNDPRTQSAVEHLLFGEDWHVEVVDDARRGMRELAEGRWQLVIASAGLVAPPEAAFTTLAELAIAPAGAGAERVRVLFLVPERLPGAQAELERRRLPYALKPLHLHDFLERVSDLLTEAGALAAPIRRVAPAPGKPAKKPATAPGTERGRMFADRSDYYMTEEEIAEYERQEAEEREKKKQPPE